MPYRPQSPIRLAEDLLPHNPATNPSYGQHSQLYIDPGDKLSLSLDMGDRIGETITHFMIRLGSGGADVDSLTWRMETQDLDGATGTLVDPNATGSIASVGGTEEWVEIPINGGVGFSVPVANPKIVLEVTGAVGQVRLKYFAEHSGSRIRNLPAPRSWDGNDWDATVSIGCPIALFKNGAAVSRLPNYTFDIGVSVLSWDTADSDILKGPEFTIDFDGKVGGVHGFMYGANDTCDIEIQVVKNGALVPASNVHSLLGHCCRMQDGNMEFRFPEVDVVVGDTIAILFKPTSITNMTLWCHDTSDANVAAIMANYMPCEVKEGATVGSLSVVADKYPIIGLMVTEIETGGGAAPDYPLEANVRFNTVYANGTMTGSAHVAQPANVRLGEPADHATGLVNVPSAANTRLGVAVDQGLGLAAIPTPANTLLGVAVDQALGLAAMPSPLDTRAGSAVNQTVGSLAVAPKGKVISGVPTDDGVGTFQSAPEVKVEIGHQYGEDGTELTGTLQTGGGGNGGGANTCTCIL